MEEALERADFQRLPMEVIQVRVVVVGIWCSSGTAFCAWRCTASLGTAGTTAAPPMTYSTSFCFFEIGL